MGERLLETHFVTDGLRLYVGETLPEMVVDTLPVIDTVEEVVGQKVLLNVKPDASGVKVPVTVWEGLFE